MFRIHEFSSADGLLSSVYLRPADDQLEIVSDDGAWTLPHGALYAVLARFGAPFDEDCAKLADCDAAFGRGTNPCDTCGTWRVTT